MVNRMRPGQGRGTGINSLSLIISVGLHLALATLIFLGLQSRKPASPPILTVSLVAPDPGLPGPGGSQKPAETQAGQAEPPSAAPTPAKKQASLAPKAKEKPPKRKAKHIARYEPEEAWPERPVRPTLLPVVKAPSPPAPAALPTAPSPVVMTVRSSSRGVFGQTTAQDGVGAGSGGSGSASAGLGQGSGGGRGEGSGGGRTQVEAQRHYLGIIRTRILAKRQYPSISRQRHEEGIVRLRFTLSSAGALAQGVQMVKPSGYHLLDDQARQCVLAASPFPPFPPDLKRDCLTVEVPIVYKLTELGM
jgi:protein TonB